MKIRRESLRYLLGDPTSILAASVRGTDLDKESHFFFFLIKKFVLGAQRSRICLPRQGTQVRSLIWEDPPCLGATKPMSHSG